MIRRFCESQEPGKLLPFIQAAFLEELTLRYAKEDWLKIYDDEVTQTYNINGFSASVMNFMWCDASVVK